MHLYDKETELNWYVLNYYSEYKTEFENLVLNAFRAHEKAKNSDSEKISKILLENAGSVDNPEVMAILKNGFDKFARKTRLRILEEHKEHVFLNYCPSCSKLVKTPKAKLCLWCNYSWH